MWAFSWPSLVNGGRMLETTNYKADYFSIILLFVVMWLSCDQTQNDILSSEANAVSLYLLASGVGWLSNNWNLVANSNRFWITYTFLAGAPKLTKKNKVNQSRFTLGWFLSKTRAKRFIATKLMNCQLYCLPRSFFRLWDNSGEVGSMMHACRKTGWPGTQKWAMSW